MGASTLQSEMSNSNVSALRQTLQTQGELSFEGPSSRPQSQEPRVFSPEILPLSRSPSIDLPPLRDNNCENHDSDSPFEEYMNCKYFLRSSFFPLQIKFNMIYDSY